MKGVLICLCCILYCGCNYAQPPQNNELSAIDTLKITQAKNVIKKVLGNETGKKTYLIFSFGDDILFVNKILDGYKLYVFTEEYNFENQAEELIEKRSLKIKQDEMLDRIFQETICAPKFTYSTEPSIKKYAHWDTNYNYFVIYKRGQKECEFIIPILNKENPTNKEIFPIDETISSYLIGRLFQ